MPDLHVSSERLEQLATTQDEASNDMDAATSATDGISDKVWKTHGYYPGCTNRAVEKAEAARRKAGEAAKEAGAGLAAKLGVARNAYADAETQVKDKFDKQMLDQADADHADT